MELRPIVSELWFKRRKYLIITFNLVETLFRCSSEEINEKENSNTLVEKTRNRRGKRNQNRGTSGTKPQWCNSRPLQYKQGRHKYTV
jgi:hypothetical protein